jgi:hypothetical protein
MRIGIEDKIRECEKIKDKNFCGKIELKELNTEDIIKKPDNADYFRTKSFVLRFYSAKPEGLCNGYRVIPKSAQYISFPELNRKWGYVHYGEPFFYDKNLKKMN